jgi:hypothetical protein
MFRCKAYARTRILAGTCEDTPLFWPLTCPLATNNIHDKIALVFTTKKVLAARPRPLRCRGKHTGERVVCPLAHEAADNALAEARDVLDDARLLGAPAPRRSNAVLAFACRFARNVAST